MHANLMGYVCKFYEFCVRHSALNSLSFNLSLLAKAANIHEYNITKMWKTLHKFTYVPQNLYVCGITVAEKISSWDMVYYY